LSTFFFSGISSAAAGEESNAQEAVDQLQQPAQQQQRLSNANTSSAPARYMVIPEKVWFIVFHTLN
jgi:hypothetical protein